MSAALSESVPDEDSHLETLATIAPFQDLPEAVLNLLCAHSERRTYSAGETVFSLGQYDGGEFVVVLSGTLRVSFVNEQTGAMSIDEVAAHEIFGLEIAVAEPDPSLYQQVAVTAEKDCDLIVLDAAEFKTIAASRPSLMRNIATYFCQALVIQRYSAATPKAAGEQRIFAVLLECVERDQVNGRWHIQRMPKHRELADRAGVEEAAAAGAVATLIQEGVAQRDYPGLIVNDMGRLNQLAT